MPIPGCLLVDSITEAVGHPQTPGAILVSGSHGGLSAARFALQAAPRAAVFNDAGVGRDQAGIAGLALLQAAGIPACTVSHDSARIGEARSTWEDGRISSVNAAAAAKGARVGEAVKTWVWRVLKTGNQGR
jgi:hypothetical protein